MGLQAILLRFRQRLYGLCLFTRFPAFGFSAILPLLGAGSAAPHVTDAQILGLLGVTTAFHLFAYVLNDVLDLPVDRTEIYKADSPVTRGAIPPWAALVFALLQAPAALALTAWLGGSGWAYVALIAAFLLMALYNLFGKRAPFPPFTDTLQGLSWAVLALYGAAITAPSPTALTWALFAFVVVFILLINGVHGSLRDLANDLRCGVRSTAILLGARPPGPSLTPALASGPLESAGVGHPTPLRSGDDRGPTGGDDAPAMPGVMEVTPPGATGLVLPHRLLAYAVMLQLILSLIILLPLALNDFSYPSAARSAMTVFQLGAAALALYLLVAAVGMAHTTWSLVWMGMLHLVVALTSLIVLLAPYLEDRLLACVLTAYVGPLLSNGWLYGALRWSWQRLARVES